MIDLPHTTVIYHSQDYDGIFCREIARKFLGEEGVNYLGWTHGDKPLLAIFPEDQKAIYVLDLAPADVFGLVPEKLPPFVFNNLIWIDHHASAILKHPTNIPGYRIDGVAACRLLWQWFRNPQGPCSEVRGGHTDGLPTKEDYLKRKVFEPLAVRLAGEYDIWEHRGDGDIEFQFGLDAQPSIDWSLLLRGDADLSYTRDVVNEGLAAMRCYKKRDADIMRQRSFLLHWHGLTFLALNTARCNSQTFAARDVPETGHDALLAFYWNGRNWIVSLYHAEHRKDLDLSKIAVEQGGGGHKGACGFSVRTLPFLPNP